METYDKLSLQAVESTLGAFKNLQYYRSLFPQASNTNRVIKENPAVYDTVHFIKRMVLLTLPDTEQFAKEIVKENLYDTCRYLWFWIKRFIKYEKDTEGEEEVRSGKRLVSDGKGDCDCYTGFINSVLTNVKRIKGWKFSMYNRITKYWKDNFQHIYPIVYLPGGKAIKMDCVTDSFDYEEEFSQKEDFMNLNYLDGFDKPTVSQYEVEVVPDGAIDGLGRIRLFKENGKVIKKGIHAVNTVNPATALLRKGFIEAMKLNALNVAGRIKWAYLSEEQAKAKGLDMKKYEKLRKLRDRMENIFYSAGGVKENLREAILTGKGNTNKEVSGLVPIYMMDGSENGSLDEGLGVASLAAGFASASAAIAAIAAAIKQIGPIKTGASESENPDSAGEVIEPKEQAGEEITESTNQQNGKSSPEPELFKNPVEWAKVNPLKAFGIVAAVGTAVFFTVRHFRNRKESSTDQLQAAVNGYKERFEAIEMSA
jgi:hypothetical protein